MLGLVPTEHWQYSLADLVRCSSAAMKSAPGARTDPAKSSIFVPGLGNSISIRSARAAVIVAIKALGLQPGSIIGVPLYCCPVVFKAIKAADCIPRFIDIDPATFCVSRDDLYAKRNYIDAIIAVHMFGNLCDMPMVLEAMDGKPVMEDCAQSLGSKLDGRASGSFGRISFFSFRSGKYLSVGEGGALFSSNETLYARILELASVLPVPNRINELKHIVVTYIRSKLRRRPLWGLMGARIWRQYNKITGFSDKSPIHLGQIFVSDLLTASRRLARLDSMISSQRANALFYDRNLRLDPSMLCREKPGAFYNRFMYPITFRSTQQREVIAGYLHSRGIGTAKPYEDVIIGAAKYYGYTGDCPMAESVLRRTLIIPSYFSLSSGDLERITDATNKGWAKA